MHPPKAADATMGRKAASVLLDKEVEEDETKSDMICPIFLMAKQSTSLSVNGPKRIYDDTGTDLHTTTQVMLVLSIVTSEM